MTNLKRSFFGLAFYLLVVFVLAQTDYVGRPIINFASYFYLSVMVAVPITLFFPSIGRVSFYIPLIVWAGFYLVLLQTIDRSASAVEGEFSVIVLEFLLLETGVWFAHQLAIQVNHAESVMDGLALSAFPHQVTDIESEHRRITIELTRSRRYHRSLGLIVIEAETDDEKLTRELLKSIQHDLLSRFSSARLGQIIDNRVRQTDVVMRDHSGKFVILCPETDLDSTTILAIRIAKDVKARMDMRVRWGAASFPDEALTFDDLLLTARTRSAEAKQTTDEQPFLLD
jgi:hypothetical protein